jgi:hypothetical protein
MDLTFVLETPDARFKERIPGFTNKGFNGRFIVARVHKGKGKKFIYEYITGTHGKTLKRLKSLPKGEYRVFAAVDHETPEINNEWSFRIYADTYIDLYETKYEKTFLREVMSEAAHKKNSTQAFSDNIPDIKYGVDYFGEDQSFMTFYFENGSKDMIFKCNTVIDNQ